MKKIFPLSLLIIVLYNFSFSGNVTGKVNFKGTAPKPTAIKMNADAKCVSMHKGQTVNSEQLVDNSNNTIQWAFIYVKSGLPAGKKYPAPKTAAKIDQNGCMYSPHIQGVMTGQQIEITNSDGTLHNIHALPKNSAQFNIAQPKQGMKTTKSFDKAEQMVKLKCEVHNWMASYIGVMDNPFFAVSDDKGNFEIKDLPPGDYELVAWHEKLGEATAKVKVTDKGATADFTFEAK